MWRTGLIVALCLLAILPVAAASLDPPTDIDGPRIVAVYPNPIPPGDPGEYVVVKLDDPTVLDGYTLSDGESVATLANRTHEGRVVLTRNPRAVRNQSTGPMPPIVALNGSLSLSNAGERLVLARNGSVVDTLRYGPTGDGEHWENGRAVPRGMTGFRPRTATTSSATAFVVPDGPGIPLEAIATATDRILLAGYTFTSQRIGTALAAAAARGVTVRVLVEGGPVGGVSNRTRAVLGWLSETAVEVRVLDGPHSRFRFHHAKYLVVDDRSLVTSENWDPGGLGGHGTRGWGVLVQNRTLSEEMAEVFQADWSWAAAMSWPRYARQTTFQPPSPASGAYPVRFPPRRVDVEDVTLLTAPDNAAGELLELLRTAEESVTVVQPRIGNETPLRHALLAAARRGVSVRILVSGSWYSEPENRALAEAFRRASRAEGLEISVRLIEPRSRFSHLHAKGMIVDGRFVVVGSINWNVVSTRENRELALIIESPEMAAYFRRVIRADWRGAAWRLPAALGTVGVGIAWLTISLVRRAITFDGRPGGRRRARQPPSSRRDGRGPPPERRGRT